MKEEETGKNKVLHIENSMHLTGAFKALLGIHSEIQKHHVSIIAFPSGSACVPLAGEKGIPTVSFPFSELRKSVRAFAVYVPYLLINTRRVLRFMKKEQINILHSNDHFNLVPVLAKAMAGKQIKLLVHVRLLPSTYNYQLYNVFRRLNVYYADRIIGVSEAIMDAYERPQKMIMIRDKIELSENHPVYIPQKKSNFKFVYISNYIQGKGQNFAVDAFQQLVVRYPQAELHFYGGTMGLEKNEHYKEQLKERVVDQKMDHLVFFHSFAADTERAYKDADVSLCFSESESFSLICLESQFYGVPVIASACGGPQEIIRHEENGLLVANRNVREMAAAMSLLLENFELRKKLSVNGRENAKSLLQATPSFCDVLKEVERI